MKLLLDTCVAKAAVETLAAAGHDADWSDTWPSNPGGDEILTRAADEGRVLVTLDQDFGELAVVHRRPHCGILRLVGLDGHEQDAACDQALRLHADTLSAGGLVTVKRTRGHPAGRPTFARRAGANCGRRRPSRWRASQRAVPAATDPAGDEKGPLSQAGPATRTLFSERKARTPSVEYL
jgi:predicted nuclease of predicted toxin-antitoxin system